MPQHESEPYPQSSLNQDNICVTLATASEGDFLNAYTIRNGNALPCDPLTAKCWVQAELDTRFSIHVGYDGTRPAYPGIGALAITVFFDGIRVSDMFITPESIAARVE
ncbi:hypothetical protein FRC08_007671 [Ceratobasidium sp. 394]|nr:hypothetical protein FRC08_007671 [Ceratobasidium sp. 394]KAG9083802.1 hypothetical protein FS749_005719 [Ceratobasidium sp. UAMH 11750]